MCSSCVSPWANLTLPYKDSPKRLKKEDRFLTTSLLVRKFNFCCIKAIEFPDCICMHAMRMMATNFRITMKSEDCLLFEVLIKFKFSSGTVEKTSVYDIHLFKNISKVFWKKINSFHSPECQAQSIVIKWEFLKSFENFSFRCSWCSVPQMIPHGQQIFFNQVRVIL